MKKCIVSVFAILALTLIAVNADAGRVGGPDKGRMMIKASESLNCWAEFRGGEIARVEVKGYYTNANFTVAVFDSQDRLIAFEGGVGDKGANIEWIPERTQLYRVVVRNQTIYENVITLTTN